MEEIVCVGGCNRGWRDAELAYARALKVWTETDPTERGDRPAKHTIRPYLGVPVWCLRCTSDIRVKLAELDDLAAIYTAAADGHRTGPAGERVSGGKGQPSPSPTHDDLDELWSVLHGWETAFRGQDPQARRGYLAQSITTVVAWLSSHFDAVIAHPDIAPEFGQDVRRWHKAFKGKSHAGVEKHAKKRACPTCDYRTLSWRDGDEYVRCDNPSCLRMLTLGEYAEYDRLCGAANLSEAS